MTGAGVRTHEEIDAGLCGVAIEVAEGRAVVELATDSKMRADGRGLVHGGFVFGLADYAAMLAVNEPTVVMAAAEMAFVAPVVVGDRLRAEGRRTAGDGRRQTVEVVVRRGDAEVARGLFRTATPERHVLDR